MFFSVFLSIGARSTRIIHSALNSEMNKMQWILEFASPPSKLLTSVCFSAVCKTNVALHQISIFMLHFLGEIMASLVIYFVSTKTNLTH